MELVCKELISLLQRNVNLCLLNAGSVNNLKKLYMSCKMETYRNRIFILFLFFFVFDSCDNSLSDNGNKPLPDNEYKVTIEQGVWGNVWFWEGDFMPMIGNSSSGKITAAERDIYIYKATSDSLTEPQNGGTFRTGINSKLISIIQSDESGFFQISLEPGKYSFFIKEDSLFYANLWDSDGHIQPAIVSADSITKRQIDINYNATY